MKNIKTPLEVENERLNKEKEKFREIKEINMSTPSDFFFSFFNDKFFKFSHIENNIVYYKYLLNISSMSTTFNGKAILSFKLDGIDGKVEDSINLYEFLNNIEIKNSIDNLNFKLFNMNEECIMDIDLNENEYYPRYKYTKVKIK